MTSDLFDCQHEPIDCAIVSDGVFQMKGKAAKDAFLLLVSEESDRRYPLFNDGKPIEANYEDNAVTAAPNSI